MSQITKSIDELVAENAGVDRQETFEKLWAINTELFEKVRSRLELTLDPCSEGLMPYTGKDGAEGYLSAWSGPKVDWLIFSWTGNPKASFTNMHLTINLAGNIDVPHFGYALGTTPDLFFYQDYMPRKDLWTHPEYADKYWDGASNDAYVAMERDENFRHFISRDMYTRVAQSPCSLVYGADVSDDNIEALRKVSHEQLDRWLDWVDQASPTTPDEAKTLAARDLQIRKTITQRDPANIVVENLFGKELADRLVGSLWGENRQLPRPE
ncbi:Uncharacterised protein [Zhongshania aliphaticivorans]|uniref:Red chlorophyll catabolite reductase n=1 Tax=Zhongshania aliphaticivorans TaxID=1470434 RepID=A0A5S9N412_9GAMM|nr:red chlorophyll catabolite reductase [Zhongshania aliphaticivorans]CAA0082041.1 Uncharacterised protein [Zhongshania aliphaticivorans]CAA0084502.1 Uncharacterised protein [Zhongshania aliphaticivorans]